MEEQVRKLWTVDTFPEVYGSFVLLRVNALFLKYKNKKVREMNTAA